MTIFCLLQAFRTVRRARRMSARQPSGKRAASLTKPGTKQTSPSSRIQNSWLLELQNVIHTPLRGSSDRELEMVVENGVTPRARHLRRQYDDFRLDDPDRRHAYSLSQLQPRHRESVAGDSARKTAREKGQFDGRGWMLSSQKLHVQANGHVNNQTRTVFYHHREREQSHQSLINELHLMHLHATDKVLKTIPTAIRYPQNSFGRVRASRSARRQISIFIIGRMGFLHDVTR